MRPIYITGLDLGQQNDYSALTVTERTMWGEKPRYSVRHLVRWPLQTPYTTIVEDVVKIFSRPPLTGTILCVDATGVGKAVVDLLRASRPEARISPIVITSGHYAARVESQWSVPKKDLVAVLQVLLSSRRFQIASGLPHARTLAKELAAFRVKIKSTTGKEVFECLVAGTLVITDRGYIPIEEVTTKDRVLTRKGYRRVLWSGPTKKISRIATLMLANGESIQGTPDHLVWTTNRGWVPLGDLRCGQTLGLGRLQPNPSYSMVWSTDDPPVRTTIWVLEPVDGCTVSCGSSTTDPSQRECTYTTGMETSTTMISPISSVSPQTNTRRFTIRSILRGIGSVLDAVKSFWSRRPIGNGIVRSDATCKPGPHETSSVSGANRSSPPLGMVATDRSSSSARMLAERRTDTGIETIQPDSVLTAERTSWPGTRKPSFVPVVVQALDVTECLETQVYDLSVEEHPEFFANGTLVHNSWRERDHDDMVLSVAMALWYGERGSLTQPLRIIVPGKSKERAKKLRIVVATGPELAETVIEDLRTLLVCVHDPASNEGEDWFTNPPKHGIDKKVFLGSLHLPFLRMEPQDYQDTWLDTIPPWNRTPPELMMSREHGKLLWKFLLQKRPEPWEILVFWDNGDGRALSLAYGICAALGLPRSRTIYCVGNPDFDLSQDPPSKFIVEQTKLCRNMIVG